jgi:hypothetical protein
MKDGMSDLLCLGESPVETAEDYLRVIGDWKDPYPAPVIVEHEGVQVVRDDLLGLGSKVGLEHPTVIASLIRVARSLNVKPDYVWSVGSSGTMLNSDNDVWRKG